MDFVNVFSQNEMFKYNETSKPHMLIICENKLKEVL